MQQQEQEFSFKGLFVPFTTLKAILWIIFIGIIVYFNSLFNGFVGDDQVQILANSALHSLANIVIFFTGSTFYNGSGQLGGYYFKPLLSVYFSFIYSIWGPNNFSFHFFQLILHISNACLLFLFLKHFFKKSISFLISLIFLIHPINSEAVLYISAAQEELFFFFGLLGLYIATNLKSQKQIMLISLFLLLSLFSKETGILFVGMVLTYTFLLNRKLFLPLMGYSGVVVSIYLILRINAVRILSSPTNVPIDRLNFLQRLLNIPSIFLFYLKTFIFPLNLSSSYEWAYTTFNISNFFLPLLVVTLFIIAIVYLGFLVYKKGLKKQFSFFIFFVTWFLVGLFMHLQIFPLDATAADRWFYFPIVGLLGMIGVLLNVWQINLRNKWSISIVFITLLLLSSRTFLRSFDWSSNNTLANHDIKVTQDSYILENTIGSDLIDQNKLLDAKVHIEKSIKFYPYLTNYLNLGVIYMRLGDYSKAKEADIHALKYYDYYVVYDNLAELSLVTGDPIKNIAFIKGTLKKFPNDGKLWLYLSILEYKMNNKDEARNAVQKAYYYGAGLGTAYVYDTIMNNKTLNLRFSNSQ